MWYKPEHREILPSLLESTDSSTGEEHSFYGLEFVPPKRKSKYVKFENCLYDLQSHLYSLGFFIPQGLATKHDNFNKPKTRGNILLKSFTCSGTNTFNILSDLTVTNCVRICSLARWKRFMGWGHHSVDKDPAVYKWEDLSSDPQHLAGCGCFCM